MAGALVCLFAALATHLWEPLRSATFSLVRFLLRPLVDNLQFDAATATLGTPRFQVVIAPE